MTIALIRPNWPAIPGIQALATTRQGGVSKGVYRSLNLGDHVGDSAELVQSNRLRLASHLRISAQSIQWLSQIHGSKVHTLGATAAQQPCAGQAPGPQPEADAAFTSCPGKVCAVLTADCLPVLFASQDGSQVAAVHAGWRGLCRGVLEAAVNCFSAPDKVQAWLGPAIGPAAFEVGSDVYEAFVGKLPPLRTCFAAGNKDRWLADIYGLARLTLASVGVTRVYGGGWCTLSDADRFFSYRRDGVTGRMATLIWKS